MIASILHSLGFKNISALFDGDKPEDLEEFKALFAEYHGFMIPADDIRDKLDANERVLKTEIFDARKDLKPEYVDKRCIFISIYVEYTRHIYKETPQ